MPTKTNAPVTAVTIDLQNELTYQREAIEMIEIIDEPSEQGELTTTQQQQPVVTSTTTLQPGVTLAAPISGNIQAREQGAMLPVPSVPVQVHGHKQQESTLPINDSDKKEISETQLEKFPSKRATNDGESEDVQLFLPEEKELVSGYIYFLMQQMSKCNLAKFAMKGNRASQIGLACRHCAKDPKVSRQFFYSSSELLCNNISQITRHLNKCQYVSEDMKNELNRLKKEATPKKQREKFIKVHDAMKLVWGRLHDGKKHDIDSIATESEVPSTNLKTHGEVVVVAKMNSSKKKKKKGTDKSRTTSTEHDGLSKKVRKRKATDRGHTTLIDNIESSAKVKKRKGTESVHVASKERAESFVKLEWANPKNISITQKPLICGESDNNKKIVTKKATSPVRQKQDARKPRAGGAASGSKLQFPEKGSPNPYPDEYLLTVPGVLRESDGLAITPFQILVFRNMLVCEVTEQDKILKKTAFPVGFRGICCRFCAPHKDRRRYFSGTCDSFTSNFSHYG